MDKKRKTLSVLLVKIFLCVIDLPCPCVSVHSAWLQALNRF